MKPSLLDKPEIFMRKKVVMLLAIFAFGVSSVALAYVPPKLPDLAQSEN